MIHPRHPALTFALLAAASPLLTGCGNLSSPGTAAHVATGYVSHQLCAAVFVAGREPEAYYRDAIEAMGGAAAFLMRHEVDRERAEVRATIAGFAESRAIYRPPFGCVNATGTPPAGLAVAPRPIVGAGIDLPPAEPLWPPIAGNAVVEPADPALRAALARAFEETTQGPKRHTEAVVVVHRNRIVAERYANGVGIETPLAGWSAAKSATNALLGILVRQGRLAMDAPAPIAAWADPRDPRHAITPDQLLRMTSGLDAGQTLRDVSAFDPAARMLFVERDMAAFAASRPLADVPGSRWTYTDPNTLLLSHIVRELSGGSAESARAFAQRELFDKLGMRHATFEFDAAGTPIGSSQLWAPARDWARLGLLYLHDGVAGGQRLLPPGWVDYSARQTPGSESVGYGAGFWTNRGGGAGATYRIAAGIPADAFMARGSHGQYVVIVPSQQLVVVRLGPAWTARDDMDTVARLVRETIAALPSQQQP
ncbi:MAG TPA: serine hydrolase [Burkholderiaceae bacterium]|nr:serine hydrolase [Burkholderiaceae bacterium]